VPLDTDILGVVATVEDIDVTDDEPSVAVCGRVRQLILAAVREDP